tara:strand:- start:140 stop:511 length:372 start_codon:yes stop_codon:yes gene_type:complete
MKIIALSTLAAIAASSALPATAGVYVNVESNAGYTGSDYEGRTTDLHLGYEGEAGKLGYYIQGGPAIISEDAAEDSNTQFSGKVGATVSATERLDVYGEVAVLTAEGDADNSYSTKIGTKFKF